jgi:hypothetical protein
VQEHQLLARGGTVNGGAVDDLEFQIRCSVEDFGDLRRVCFDATNRLRVARPVADDVVGRTSRPRDKSGAAQNAAKSSALNFGAD